MAATGASRKLTAKQAAFVREYLVDSNATAAARRAGYSEKTAEVQGYQLLQLPLVRGAVAEGQRQMAERTHVTVDRIVEELAAIAFADILDYAEVDERECSVVVEDYDTETRRPVRTTKREVIQTVVVNNTRTLTKRQRKAIAEVKHEFDKFGNRAIGVKLHSKDRALELLGKHFGMWADKADGKAQAIVEALLEKMRGRVPQALYDAFLDLIAEEMGVRAVATTPAAGSPTDAAVH